MSAPSIAIREWAVVIIGSITLVFSAWALAGVQLWSLHALLIGGSLTFLLAIVPLPRRFNGDDGEHGNLQNFIRLLAFPFFWLSLLFLLYISIQGFNSSWEQVRNEKGWWMERVEPVVTWLPTGVRADYEPMNAFRVLANFTAAFTLVWGLWVGVRRRQCAIILIWSLILSGVIMAIVAILQQFTAADAVLWTVRSSNDSFWGTFFYRNQGVAYLTLILIASAVMYFYHFNRAERSGASGGPHLLLFVFIAVLATSIGLALSRGGILFGGLFVCVFILAALGRGLFSHSVRNSLLLTTLIAVLLGGAAYGMLRYVDMDAIEKRFGDVEEAILTVDKDSRAMTTKITWKMAQESLWMGAGAGSWRYIFPMYQKSYPEIFYVRYHRVRGWEGRRFFRYAHNDIVQFLYEFGIVGYSLLILAFAYWIFLVLWRSGGNALSALMLLFGLGVIIGHAFVDFIFQSPAYWLAMNGLFCVSAKLLVLDSRRRYG